MDAAGDPVGELAQSHLGAGIGVHQVLPDAEHQLRGPSQLTVLMRVLTIAEGVAVATAPAERVLRLRSGTSPHHGVGREHRDQQQPPGTHRAVRFRGRGPGRGGSVSAARLAHHHHLTRGKVHRSQRRHSTGRGGRPVHPGERCRGTVRAAVRSPALQKRPAVDRRSGQLRHRLRGILFPGAREPHGSYALHRGAAQDHAGGHLAVGVFGAVPAGAVPVELPRRVSAHRCGGVRGVPGVVSRGSCYFRRTISTASHTNSPTVLRIRCSSGAWSARMMNADLLS